MPGLYDMCEDAPCCGCCGVDSPDVEPDYVYDDVYDFGQYDNDPNPYEGTYSEC